MAQPVIKAPMKEINNHKQGRTGSGVNKRPGPATGRRGNVNKTKGGGINRPTKSKSTN